jgi:hypothetical protein
MHYYTPGEHTQDFLSLGLNAELCCGPWAPWDIAYLELRPQDVISQNALCPQHNPLPKPYFFLLLANLIHWNEWLLKGPFTIIHDMEGMLSCQVLCPLSASLPLNVPLACCRQPLHKLFFLHVASIFLLMLVLSFCSEFCSFVSKLKIKKLKKLCLAH